MKIATARVIVTCPGRNFVTLKIETDQGVYGIGDGTLSGRELSVVSYLESHVAPALVGMDQGCLHCGEAPGHGVDINEQLAENYPYKAASLPVARLGDGTMWNW